VVLVMPPEEARVLRGYESLEHMKSDCNSKGVRSRASSCYWVLCQRSRPCAYSCPCRDALCQEMCLEQAGMGVGKRCSLAMSQVACA